MYMVIHDLKHPTESLISSLNNMLAKFDTFENKIMYLEHLCRKQPQSGMQSESGSSMFAS